MLTRMQAAFEDMLDSLTRKPVTDFSRQADFVNHMMDRTDLSETNPAKETDRTSSQSGHTEMSRKEET